MSEKEKMPDYKGDTSYLAYWDFLEEFKTESDRASVILGAARLDLGLYHILQHALLPDPTKTDDLLEGDNPLSTFSARINACYRLGLIDAEVARSLHLIRKIRNVFAHETSGSSLNSGSHRDRVRELARPFIKFKQYIDYRDERFPDYEGASRDFRAVSALLVIRLDGGLHYIPSFNAKDCITLMPPSFSTPEALGEENKETTAQSVSAMEADNNSTKSAEKDKGEA